MTSYVRHDLPADIAIFAGDFQSQPLAFAHLMDAAPDLDLTHVEVLQGGAKARLEARFGPDKAARIAARAKGWNTIFLILPAAYEALTCPVGPTPLMQDLGQWRGTVPRMLPRGEST